jgi:hypothetical protein
MNAKNRMCKLSAAKGSKWFKEPPCEWVSCTPGLVSQANKEQSIRAEKWGVYCNNPAMWPKVRFAYEEVVYAQYFMQSEQRRYTTLGSIIGVYCHSATDSQVYHIRFNMLGGHHHGYCSAVNVEPGEETTAASKAARDAHDDDVFQTPKEKKVGSAAKSAAIPKALPQIASNAAGFETPKVVSASPVFSVGTRVFVQEVGGLGTIAHYVQRNEQIDGYCVSYTKEPDFKKGEMECCDHSCDEVFKYLEKDAWVTKTIARQKRVQCVHGFNTDSGKGTEYAGFGNVVGLCIDIRNRPRFYAVFMDFDIPEVFYFSVDDVKEVEDNARNTEQQPAEPVYSAVTCTPADEQTKQPVRSSSAQPAVQTGDSKTRLGTLEHANAALAAGGWRRCISMEGGHQNHNVEHDDFVVVHTQRDGDCLFHCFAAIVQQLSQETNATQATMRMSIAEHFRQNNGTIVCESSRVDGSDLTSLPYTCDDINAIETGTRGLAAYGSAPEIAAFCKIHELSVLIFSPEASYLQAPPLLMNPVQGKRYHMLLQTFAWTLKGSRQRGKDHWQLLEHKQQQHLVEPPAAAHHQPQQQSPNKCERVQAITPSTQQSNDRAAKRAARKAEAQQEKAEDDERQVEVARAFLAGGGTFNYEEPGEKPLHAVAVPLFPGQYPDLDDLKRKAAHLHRVEAAAKQSVEGRASTEPVVTVDSDDIDADPDGAGGNVKSSAPLDGDTGGDVESTEQAGGGGKAKSSALPDGGEKRKVTHWVHETRITCLRLIQRLNPFAAKDSGLMWQQIADQMNRETANVVVTKKGKVVSCQVHSNGTALMMWYTRQLGTLESAYSEKSDKQSGQTGQFKGAIQTRARQSGENEEELELEWSTILNLKALQKDANEAATLKKLSAGKAKDYKDKHIPDAVLEAACNSRKVETQAIAELERRAKKASEEESILAGANRFAVMTDQQKREHALLQQLKDQRAKRVESDSAEDGKDADLSSDNKGRGKNNLKRSFDNMTEQMTQLTKFMKDDSETPEQATTLQDLQLLLSGIDDDVATGLKLEADERAQLRAMYIRQYAKSRIQAVQRIGNKDGNAK